MEYKKNKTQILFDDKRSYIHTNDKTTNLHMYRQIDDFIHETTSEYVKFVSRFEIKPAKLALTPKELSAFTESIKSNGILEPIVIDCNGNITDGNKRYFTATYLDIPYLPCIKENDPYTPAYILHTNNITDPHVHFFEKAKSVHELTHVHLFTQEKIAGMIGSSQSFIANKARLLNFSEYQMKLIIRGNLTERHARCLLKIKNTELRNVAICHIIDCGMNVSLAEQYVDELIISDIGSNSPNADPLPPVLAACKEIDKLSGTAEKMGLFLKINRSEDAHSINYTVKIYK